MILKYVRVIHQVIFLIQRIGTPRLKPESRTSGRTDGSYSSAEVEWCLDEVSCLASQLSGSSGCTLVCRRPAGRPATARATSEDDADADADVEEQRMSSYLAPRSLVGSESY